MDVSYALRIQMRVCALDFHKLLVTMTPVDNKSTYPPESSIKTNI